MLTRREFQVYMLIVEWAKSREQIAAVLGISINTARTHTQRVKNKLGFTTSLQMLCAYHRAEQNI